MLIVVCAAVSVLTAATPSWWKTGFAQRKGIVIKDTNACTRHFAVTMVDISSITNELVDTTGADIRVIMSNGAMAQVCKVLLDGYQRAKYIVFTYSLSAGATSNVYLYYNYNPLSGNDIPDGRKPVAESSYVAGSRPADYLFKAGVVGGYGGDLRFIKDVLGLEYEMLSYIPTNRYSHDVLIHNDNYATNNISNYVKFVNNIVGNFSDGRGGGGIIMGNTLGSVTTTERLLHVYAPFIPEGGRWFNSYAKVQVILTNTNHFSSALEGKDTLLLDWASVLRYGSYIDVGTSTARGPLDYSRWYTYTYNNSAIPPTRTTNTNQATTMYYRDYKLYSYSPLLNGREFVVGCLTNTQFMTPAGKRVMKRAFIWTGGFETNYDNVMTPQTTIHESEYGTYVKGLHVLGQGSVLKGMTIEGKIIYHVDMDRTMVPVIALSNIASQNASITLSERSYWADSRTYMFYGRYSSTPAVGRQMIMVKPDTMKAADGSTAENPFTVNGFYYSSGNDNADKYRFIPRVLHRTISALSRTEVTLNLTSPRNVSIAVFDKTGVKVRTLLQNAYVISGKIVTWDGNTDNNLPVAPGLFLMKVDIEQEGTFYSHVRMLE